MRICKLFDKYRDGELGPSEREEFEMHLAVCEDCRTKKSLIDNVALVLKQDDASAPPDLSRRIAGRAFNRSRSWDSLVVSWLRPWPALAALTATLVIFSFLWILLNRPVVTYSEYESFLNEADALRLSSSVTQGHTNSELVLWLEQVRYAQ